MDPITQALQALAAVDDGDTATAEAHVASARRQARRTARRDRQIVEIAALVVAGDHCRAAGLTMEHTAEFPDDAGLLERLAKTGD
jgi:hypothetical protein